MGSIVELIKGDTRSLDYSSHSQTPVWKVKYGLYMGPP